MSDVDGRHRLRMMREVWQVVASTLAYVVIVGIALVLIGSAVSKTAALILALVWLAVGAVLLYLVGVGATAIARERYRWLHGLCIGCGYDVRGIQSRCPECGRKIIGISSHVRHR